MKERKRKNFCLCDVEVFLKCSRYLVFVQWRLQRCDCRMHIEYTVPSKSEKDVQKFNKPTTQESSGPSGGGNMRFVPLIFFFKGLLNCNCQPILLKLKSNCQHIRWKQEYRLNESQRERSTRVNSYRSMNFKIWSNSTPNFNVHFLEDYYRYSKTVFTKKTTFQDKQVEWFSPYSENLKLSKK